MTYTQAQIDRANAANLEVFLRAQGETLVRSGKEYRWKAHDSLTVCGNKWFRHSQSKGALPVEGFALYKGIPYAAAPVANLRWKAPVSKKPWKGVFKADKWGDRPPQPIDPSTGLCLGGSKSL